MDLVDRKYTLVFEKDFGEERAVAGFRLDEMPRIVEGKDLVVGQAIIGGVRCAIKFEGERIHTKCEVCDEKEQPCIHTKVFWHKHMKNIWLSRQKFAPAKKVEPLPEEIEEIDKVVEEAEKVEKVVEDMFPEAESAEATSKDVNKGKVIETANRVQQLLEKEEERIAELVEEADVKQIILSLTGDYKDLPMLYRIRTKTGERVIPSWAAITKAARLQGNLEVVDVSLKEVQGKLIAEAKVKDLKRNVTMISAASRLPKGSESFAIEILTSKAVRNALRKLLDPDILAKVIEHAKKVESIQTLDLREAATP